MNSPPPRPSADGKTPAERNVTESILLPIRLPPGWLAAIDEVAQAIGKDRSGTIKEAIRRLVKQETGIRLPSGRRTSSDSPAGSSPPPVAPRKAQPKKPRKQSG